MLDNNELLLFSMEEILADSDSEVDEMEIDEPKTKAKKLVSTWIEEDPDTIIDFTDPAVTKKITGKLYNLFSITLEI